MSNGLMNGFTPTERRILDVLMDEERHHGDELVACIDDPEPGRNILSVHLANMRDKLTAKGRKIIFIRDDREPYYQLVRRIYSGTEG